MIKHTTLAKLESIHIDTTGLDPELVNTDTPVIVEVTDSEIRYYWTEVHLQQGEPVSIDELPDGELEFWRGEFASL
jgi:hypothetical protein